MHGNHWGVFEKSTRAGTSEFLHMSAHTKQVAQVNAKRTNVSSCLTVNPDNAQISRLIVIDKV